MRMRKRNVRNHFHSSVGSTPSSVAEVDTESVTYADAVADALSVAESVAVADADSVARVRARVAGFGAGFGAGIGGFLMPLGARRVFAVSEALCIVNDGIFNDTSSDVSKGFLAQ